MTIQEIANKFHWASFASDGVLEVFLDHHTLSTYRMCESKFELEFLGNYRGKGGKSWSLEFGTVFHKVIEKLYELKQKNEYDLNTITLYALSEWDKYELDEFKEHKTYQALGGRPGFAALVIQYSDFYSHEQERLRPIGVELSFGKGREVSLGELLVEPYCEDMPDCSTNAFRMQRTIRCYLAGRIDFLMDSGSAIGPMDHKTAAFFKGNPAENHNPQEGMTGYVYASREIIKNKFPELLQTRKVDRIWMNYVQVKAEADFNKRFKRIPIFKTDFQLEQFRLRQLTTIEKIIDFLKSGRTADWNTSVCANTFHQDCTFKNLHKQNSSADMLTILNNDFYVAPEWNPDKMEERDAAQKESV